MKADRDGRTGAGRERASLVVSRPLPWVRQNDVRLHDGVQQLEVGRLGRSAVVGLLAGIRVMPTQQLPVRARDVMRGRRWHDAEDRIVVRLVSQGCFLADRWWMGRWPPARTGGHPFGRPRRGPRFLCATSAVAWREACAPSSDTAGLRLPLARSTAQGTPGGQRRSGLGQALISWRCPLEAISMRRGFAFSATGMRSVRTPAS